MKITKVQLIESRSNRKHPWSGFPQRGVEPLRGSHESGYDHKSCRGYPAGVLVPSGFLGTPVEPFSSIKTGIRQAQVERFIGKCSDGTDYQPARTEPGLNLKPCGHFGYPLAE